MLPGASRDSAQRIQRSLSKRLIFEVNALLMKCAIVRSAQVGFPDVCPPQFFVELGVFIRVALLAHRVHITAQGQRQAAFRALLHGCSAIEACGRAPELYAMDRMLGLRRDQSSKPEHTNWRREARAWELSPTAAPQLAPDPLLTSFRGD